MEIIRYSELKLELDDYGIILHVDGVFKCALSYDEAEWIHYMDYGLLPYYFGRRNIREYRLVYSVPTLKLV